LHGGFVIQWKACASSRATPSPPCTCAQIELGIGIAALGGRETSDNCLCASWPSMFFHDTPLTNETLLNKV
jgi:hypothetical protein